MNMNVVVIILVSSNTSSDACSSAHRIIEYLGSRAAILICSGSLYTLEPIVFPFPFVVQRRK